MMCIEIIFLKLSLYHAERQTGNSTLTACSSTELIGDLVMSAECSAHEVNLYTVESTSSQHLGTKKSVHIKQG